MQGGLRTVTASSSPRPCTVSGCRRGSIGTAAGPSRHPGAPLALHNRGEHSHQQIHVAAKTGPLRGWAA
eukprot:9474299-Alexandrium_andersonii.AAC.1